MRIRSKLITAFVLVALLPILLLSLLNQRGLRRSLTANANQALFTTASQAVDSIDDFLTDGLDSVRVESHLPELSSFLSLASQQRDPEGAAYRSTLSCLNALSRKNQLFVSSYGLLDRSGMNVIDTYAPLRGGDESQSIYFRQAITTTVPHVSPVLISGAHPRDAGLFFSCAVLNHEHEMIGVLRTRYRAAVLQQSLVQTTRHLGRGCLALLLDEQSICLAHSSQLDWILTPVTTLNPATISLLKADGRLPPSIELPARPVLEDLGIQLQHTLHQPFFQFHIPSQADDVTFAAARAKVKQQPWSVVFAMPSSVFLAPIDLQIQQTVLVATIIFIGGVAIALVVAQLLSRPIMKLRWVAGEVARGNLQASVPVDSRDEIGELATTFNTMTENLRELFKGLQKREEALRDNEQRFRKFFELGLVGMGIISVEKQWLHINHRLSEIFGSTRQELFKTSLPDLVHVDDRKECERLIHQLLTGKVPSISTQLRFVSQTGQEVIAATSMTCVRGDSNEVEYLILLIEDLTERHQAELQRRHLEERLARSRKMEALGLLAGGVAHDLNNVLSGIVSYPELLLMDLPEDSPLRKPVKTMQESGTRAAAIVQDLLTLARRGVTSTTVLNLNDVIRDYLDSAEHHQLCATHQDTDYAVHLGADLLNLQGSSVHLSKTIMNLVVNATESLSNGGRVVISTCNRYVDTPLKAYDEVKEGEYVVMCVQDDGVGLTQQELQRIFEPFYTKKVMGRSGTGLGLAVVWGTVHDLNGYIDVHSTPNRGTRFELYFPASRLELDRQNVSLDHAAYRGSGEHLLVVDDIAQQREIAAQILQSLGYTVTTVSSGEEAVEYLAGTSVDLLVLDMIMEPGIDGLETYRRIKQRHPGQRAIIASGYAEDERVKQVQLLGAGRYVQKPYSVETIGLAVKAELEKEVIKAAGPAPNGMP